MSKIGEQGTKLYILVRYIVSIRAQRRADPAECGSQFLMRMYELVHNPHCVLCAVCSVCCRIVCRSTISGTVDGYTAGGI